MPSFSSACPFGRGQRAIKPPEGTRSYYDAPCAATPGNPERAKSVGIEVFFPSRALSTDNAAMIAAAAYSRFRNGVLADASLNADASLTLT